MAAERDHTGSRKIFKDEGLHSRESLPASPEKLISIRRSEIISIAPDSANWNNIYSGKKSGLHSRKSET